MANDMHQHITASFDHVLIGCLSPYGFYPYEEPRFLSYGTMNLNRSSSHAHSLCVISTYFHLSDCRMQ